MLLIFTACLFASPVDCRNERIPLEGGPMLCITRAQSVLAEWANDHPARGRIAGFRCEDPARGRKEI